MSQGAHNPTGGAPGKDPRELLEAYLDGQLEGEALAGFERALAADAALRADVEAQRTINASLTRLFACEAPLKLRGAGGDGANGAAMIEPPALRLAGEGPSPEAKAKRVSERRRRVLPWAAAAAVLVAGFMGLHYTGYLSEWITESNGLINPAAVYARKVKTGFNPEWRCENDAQFLALTTQWWKKGFVISDTDEVKIVGWSYYEPVLSTDTKIILATVGGKEVIVVLDLKENDRRIRLPADSGLHDFRREVGNVVMHEITPLSEPRVVPLAKQP